MTVLNMNFSKSYYYLYIYVTKSIKHCHFIYRLLVCPKVFQVAILGQDISDRMYPVQLHSNKCAPDKYLLINF